MNLINVSFHNNTSQRHGGGVFLREAWAIVMKNCRFYNNSVKENGGGARIIDTYYIYLLDL